MITMNESLTSEQQERLESIDYMGERVRLCEDGKYRWTYPMNMLKNPSVYFTICKIFGVLALILFVFIYFDPIIHGDFGVILGDLKWWGVAILVFLAISGLSYLIVAGMYGNRYIVQFTMDENGIKHEQTPEQKKIARNLGATVAGAGVLTGNVLRTGQGVMVASHTSLSSDFSAVYSVKPSRRWGTIKVNEPLAHNQVYTSKEDFDFVLDYIVNHCPKVKKT